MRRVLTPHSKGVQQIMQILGIDDMLVTKFILTVDTSSLPTLEVHTNPQESGFTGCAVKRFKLEDLSDDQVR